MLGLPFEVKIWMIWLLIIAGGGLLLLFQYACSALVSGRIIRKLYGA